MTWCFSTESPSIVLEYLPHGDLKTFLTVSATVPPHTHTHPHTPTHTHTGLYIYIRLIWKGTICTYLWTSAMCPWLKTKVVLFLATYHLKQGDAAMCYTISSLWDDKGGMN